MRVIDEHLTFDASEHRYFLDGRECPGVTSVLKDIGIVNYSYINQDTLQRAAKFGSAVHKATELWDLGKLYPESLSDPIVPYLDAWKSFIDDFGFVPDVIELPIYSLKYRYACTPDRFGIISKGPLKSERMVCVEIKTGLVLPGAAIQTAAQMGAHNEMYPRNKVYRRLVVALKEGKYSVEEFKNQADFSTWISALQVWNFRKQNNIK